MSNTKEASSTPVTGWAALREDIERRLSEARQEKRQLSGLNRAGSRGWFYNGEIAALEYLLKSDDRRREAQPNDSSSPTPAREAEDTTRNEDQ